MAFGSDLKQINMSIRWVRATDTINSFLCLRTQNDTYTHKQPQTSTFLRTCTWRNAPFASEESYFLQWIVDIVESKDLVGFVVFLFCVHMFESEFLLLLFKWHRHSLCRTCFSVLCSVGKSYFPVFCSSLTWIHFLCRKVFSTILGRVLLSPLCLFLFSTPFFISMSLSFQCPCILCFFSLSLSGVDLASKTPTFIRAV